MIRCGERMAALRVKLGLTQEELSGKLGISRAALSHYETNRREPDYMTLCTIANYFQVSLDYILCRIEEPILSQEDSASIKLDGYAAADLRQVTVDGQPLTTEEAHILVNYVREQRRNR